MLFDQLSDLEPFVPPPIRIELFQVFSRCSGVVLHGSPQPKIVARADIHIASAIDSESRPVANAAAEPELCRHIRDVQAPVVRLAGKRPKALTFGSVGASMRREPRGHRSEARG
jgi:hypothetical protein